MVGVTTDPNSGSNFDEIVTTHIDIDWELDFETDVLNGTCTHKLRVLKDGVQRLKMDTRAMMVLRVMMDGEPLMFWLRDEAQLVQFGTRLVIDLPNDIQKDQELEVEIKYRTLYPHPSNVSALQWLKAEQTSGGTAPFLFSQCQAIHARSILPCMDTPAVKQTYSAKVSVPEAMVALMSAVPDKANDDAPVVQGRRTFAFQQKVPIPSYLIAVVAGALERAELSPRCAVWAEPQVIEKAAWEFAQTEEILQLAEEQLIPYEWGRYDLLVLPATFPFGGMENPCLTFVTPTLLAEDRSLTYVIAHEIAHSWTGNLVTNATWEHFWLNEGFTTFLERKITSRLLERQFPGTKAADHRNALAVEGYEELRMAVEEQYDPSHPYTHMCVDADNTDPDEAFSSVPYEKGHAFLFYLEKLVGGPNRFDAWLRLYIEAFKYKSVTTEEWREHFTTHFSDVDFSNVQWEKWFHTPGMPLVEPKYDDSLLQVARELGDEWLKGAGCEDDAAFNKLTSIQKTHLLDHLLHAVISDGKKIPSETLAKMLKIYKLNEVKNSEIRLRWTRLCLRCHFEPIVDMALDFVTIQGRMKFTRPVYRALFRWEATRGRAEAHFEKSKEGMHPMTASLVARDLALFSTPAP